MVAFSTRPYRTMRGRGFVRAPHVSASYHPESLLAAVATESQLSAPMVRAGCERGRGLALFLGDLQLAFEPDSPGGGSRRGGCDAAAASGVRGSARGRGERPAAAPAGDDLL